MFPIYSISWTYKRKCSVLKPMQVARETLGIRNSASCEQLLVLEYVVPVLATAAVIT